MKMNRVCAPMTILNGPVDHTRDIRRLGDLPAHLWESVPKPKRGYNYQTEVSVGGSRLVALFDTGASTSAVAEEVVVSIVNRARSRGLVAEDGEWPVKFERWEDATGISGIVTGRALKVIGSVVLAVHFGKREGRQTMQAMRFKIIAKGTCSWAGLVIGGSFVGRPASRLGTTSLCRRTLPTSAGDDGGAGRGAVSDGAFGRFLPQE